MLQRYSVITEALNAGTEALSL